ncbi:hypothetical protein NR402_07440 [Acidithiobacillus ferrooxidans]|uniref:hypothetical protein n=1 Tax=Acidithiobacillus ferrooxidans TaxID=920 RepID=UPI000A9610D4|nr:hypothetical protein [Acidithiobacillus ferrooxidans]MCR2830114.1 hypothetical protein [Acidithiobacillus ferrooxidans]
MKQHALQIALDCRKARMLDIQRTVEDLAKRLGCLTYHHGDGVIILRDIGETAEIIPLQARASKENACKMV